LALARAGILATIFATVTLACESAEPEPTPTRTANETFAYSQTAVVDSEARRQIWIDELIARNESAADIERVLLEADVDPSPAIDEALRQAEVVGGTVIRQAIVRGRSEDHSSTYLISAIQTDDGGDPVEVSQLVSVNFDPDGSPVIGYVSNMIPLEQNARHAVLAAQPPVSGEPRPVIPGYAFALGDDNRLEPLGEFSTPLDGLTLDQVKGLASDAAAASE
jgi:hypothetical protein